MVRYAQGFFTVRYRAVTAVTNKSISPVHTPAVVANRTIISSIFSFYYCFLKKVHTTFFIMRKKTLPFLYYYISTSAVHVCDISKMCSSHLYSTVCPHRISLSDILACFTGEPSGWRRFSVLISYHSVRGVPFSSLRLVHNAAERISKTSG